MPYVLHVYYFLGNLPPTRLYIPTHYHLQDQANPKKMAQKNWCYFWHLWEKRDYPMTFFFNSHCGLLRSLRSNDLGWLNFEVATSKVWHCFSKFGSSPQKGKVRQTVPKFWFIWLCYIAFCITYMSTVKFEILQSQKNQNFGTVCRTEVYLTFLRWGAKLEIMIFKISRSQPQNFIIWVHLTGDLLCGKVE